MTINWRTIHSDLTLLQEDRAHSLSFYSSQRNYDAATGLLIHQQTIIDVRGLPVKMPFGKFEQSSTTESKNTLTLDYIKVRSDGVEIFLFDRFNYIYRVNGTDYLAAIRNNLGLS